MNDTASTTPTPTAQETVLDPISRASEILFGLIMVLSFTCSMNVTSAGRADVRELLVGALGCNIAWGIIDAFFYLMGVMAQRGRERLFVQKLKIESDQNATRALLENIIPESVLKGLSASGLKEIKNLLVQNEEHGSRIISWNDLKAVLLIFALVFLTTFPVAIPFMVMHSVEPALRISNFIALLLLFGVGCSLGRYGGYRGWVWGLAMVVIGGGLVLLTIALGG